MKRIAIIMLAATALLSPRPAAAQTLDASGVKVLTLQQCRELAAANNAKVKMAENKRQAAEAVKREAFTKYFPTVWAGGTWFKSNKPVFHYDVLDMFSIEFLDKGTGAAVSAIQPVFMGGRIVNGNKLAQVGVDAGNLERENAVDEVMTTVEGYYWSLVSLKSKKETLTTVLAMVDTLANQVGVAVDAGVVLRNDLLKVQLRRNELRTLMVDLDNGIELSKKQLAQYVGLDGEAVDVAAAEVPADMPPYPEDIFVESAKALPGTVDYRLLEAQVKAADLKTKMEIGNYLPIVGVGAGYFYDDLLNQKYNFGAVFVNVTIPISSWWGGSHAIKKSKLEAANARMELDDLGQMLKLNMDNNWDELTAAYRKMTIARESIDQATENLRLSENQYHAGVTTITELLDAQTLYRQSQDSYTEAYCDFSKKRANYLDATGRAGWTAAETR